MYVLLDMYNLITCYGDNSIASTEDIQIEKSRPIIGYRITVGTLESSEVAELIEDHGRQSVFRGVNGYIYSWESLP